METNLEGSIWWSFTGNADIKQAIDWSHALDLPSGRPQVLTNVLTVISASHDAAQVI